MNYFVSYRLQFSTVKTIRFVLCLAVLLGCTPLIHAQDEPPVPVVDTVVAPEIVAPPIDFHNNDDDEKIEKPLETSTPEFRQVPDTVIQGLKNRKEFSYANDPGFWKPEPRVTNSKGFWDYFYEFFSSNGVRMIAYFLLIAFFVYVIYRIIVVNKLYLFYSSKKAKTVAAGEASDIQDINLDEKIQQALAAKDHRMAVRYMYLKALKLLNERQWIRYHADGTNYEYVNQMSGRKQANDFSYLTRIYDYVWYGEFAVTQDQFDIVYKNFSHFYNAVKS